MSAKHITFANLDDKIDALSLSDCPDADSVASIHDAIFMSSSSGHESVGLSDPGRVLDISVSSEQSSEPHAVQKPKRKRHRTHKVPQQIVTEESKAEPVTPKAERFVHKLTFNDFVYHPIKYGDEEKVLKYHPDQIVIKLLPGNYVYECLTPYKHRYYKHDCPLIRNTAPTLDQYYQMFKVYNDDRLYYSAKDSPMPKDSFFDKLNKNFAVDHVIHKRHEAPKYWYHYDKSSKTHEQWTMKQAQREYCRLYQESIFDNYESKSMFTIIHSYATHRALQYPVVICGYYVEDSYARSTPVVPTDMYQRFSYNYTFEYAFVEMLVNYPVLSLCSWAS